MRARTRRTQAMATIRVALQDHDLDADQLRARLTRRGLNPRWLPHAVRGIRDLYGDNSLVTRRDEANPMRVLYVLDPEVNEARAYLSQQGKRARTEMRHLLHHLQWLESNYHGVPQIRNAQRYTNNALEEIDELIRVTA